MDIKLGSGEVASGQDVDALIAEMLRMIRVDERTGVERIEGFFWHDARGTARLNLNSRGESIILRQAAENIKSPLLDNGACWYTAGHPKQEFQVAVFQRLKNRKAYKELAASFNRTNNAERMAQLEASIERMIETNKRNDARIAEYRAQLAKLKG